MKGMDKSEGKTGGSLPPKKQFDLKNFQEEHQDEDSNVVDDFLESSRVNEELGSNNEEENSVPQAVNQQEVVSDIIDDSVEQNPNVEVGRSVNEDVQNQRKRPLSPDHVDRTGSTGGNTGHVGSSSHGTTSYERNVLGQGVESAPRPLLSSASSRHGTNDGTRPLLDLIAGSSRHGRNDGTLPLLDLIAGSSSYATTGGTRPMFDLNAGSLRYGTNDGTRPVLDLNAGSSRSGMMPLDQNVSGQYGLHSPGAVEVRDSMRSGSHPHMFSRQPQPMFEMRPPMVPEMLPPSVGMGPPMVPQMLPPMRPRRVPIRQPGVPIRQEMWPPMVEMRPPMVQMDSHRAGVIHGSMRPSTNDEHRAGANMDFGSAGDHDGRIADASNGDEGGSQDRSQPNDEQGSTPRDAKRQKS